ncbi:aldo/keto reductase [Methanolobus sediminis]|uniref:Aldo/keto reductase n=1 Tax=Methanolobus sediminis TaxID=3072978 RepID=A0AA51YHU7_9EURY|nr:aldo/keto reductase [Methanolobus sediminis]WMW23816.1 aldo/keto reductase [Methanolobus sediminis]
MLYRKMPKNGDELSILGFGAMRLPLKEDMTIDEPRAMKQVRCAIDNGVNYVDTAWPYHMGKSEPFLGRALADGYREKVKLATKLPIWIVKSREDMDKFLNAQLERLNTDHIDYYLIHGLNGKSWIQMKELGVTEFLDTAKADGRIINAGFSFHGNGKDFAPIVDGYDWDFCQIQYNYMDERNQAGTEGLEYAASKGLGIIIMEPLRGGNLTNPVPPEIEEIWNTAKIKRSPAEWALCWIWNHPEVTVVLSGMNEESHIEENLRIADEGKPNTLTESELQLVGKAERKYREIMKAGCTGCRYCMPCPAAVDIPTCLEVYNNLHMFKKEMESKMMYTMRLAGIVSADEAHFASQCVKCGECLDRCPQHLPIPDLLEEVVKDLEGDDLGLRVEMVKEMFFRT